MANFSVKCETCAHESELRDGEENERFVHSIVILQHHQGIRFVCKKCGSQLIIN